MASACLGLLLTYTGGRVLVWFAESADLDFVNPDGLMQCVLSFFGSSLFTRSSGWLWQPCFMPRGSACLQ